jgi:oleate hydratase
MEAVYTLLDIERRVPEVFNSTYDIRTLLAASVLRDGKPLDIPGPDFLRRRCSTSWPGTRSASSRRSRSDRRLSALPSERQNP